MAKLTPEQAAVRQLRAEAVRDKLRDPARPQLTLEDVVDTIDPNDVVRAINQGQLVELGYGVPKRPM